MTQAAHKLNPRTLKYRLAKPADDGQLVRLLNSAFRTPVTEAEWHWFTCGNPLGPSRIYLAENKADEVVGCYGMFPARIKLGHHVFSASFGHQLVIREDSRGGGTFITLSERALTGERQQGSAFAIATANRLAYPLHRSLIGWSDFGTLDLLCLESPMPLEHRCLPVSMADSAFDRFFGQVMERYEFCFERSAAWVNWRFGSRPGRPYTIFTCSSRRGMEGYVVLKRWQESDGYRKAHVMDLQALTPDAVTELLRAARDYAADCNELNLWCSPGYPYRKVMEESGFRARPDVRQPVIVYGLNGGPPVLPAGSTVFMYGDADGY